MGRKPGVPNNPKPADGISRSDAIMAVAFGLSDDDLRVGLIIRSMAKLNARGQIEFLRFLIKLFEEPLKYVKSSVTMSECANTVADLNRMIKELQKKLEGQEANTDDEVHQ